VTGLTLPGQEALRRWSLSAPGRRALGGAVAVAAPGLVTLLALTSVASAVPRMLYIAAITVAAAVGGTAAGLAAAVLAFAAFAYFFAPPLDSATISAGSEAVSLAVFLVVGAAIGQYVAQERRARQRAEQAAAHTRRLEAVARALAQARAAQQVLDAILTEGLAAAEARAGLIGVVSEDGETIEVIAHRGYERERFEAWTGFPVRERLPLSDAVRTGEPVYLASTAERDRRYPPLARPPERSHALACLPLVFEGRTLGGLVLSFPGDVVFDAERRALKEALAAQAAAALDRARLDQAERELRQRLAFLAEASALLASSLDYERTLRRFAELCVPRLADWCAIDMPAADGSIERLVVAHPDPEKVRYAHELTRRFPADPDAPTGVPKVLRTGETEFVPEISDELLAAATQDDEELLRIARELRLRSAITVPLAARGRILGALSLVAAESGRRYTQADVEFATDLARRAAVAVDNARLHAEAERRADAARALRYVEEGVVLVDLSGAPRYWNEAARGCSGTGAT
jgi:GAF domain-containing protein